MSQPNFVVFIPDQLRFDAVGCFGNDLASTPNLDSLAARETRFTRAYGQHSVCSPSHVSFLTGWYPHVRGHRTLGHHRSFLFLGTLQQCCGVHFLSELFR
jgi:arylsulfatase A-like enzyme